jgi:hypothetical protein
LQKFGNFLIDVEHRTITNVESFSQNEPDVQHRTVTDCGSCYDFVHKMSMSLFDNFFPSNEVS